MTDELLSSSIDEDVLSSQRAAQLVQRQDALQDEARIVLEQLDLLRLLSVGGTVRQIGSSVLGLMVWRDLDLSVSSPGLSIERAFEVLRPLLTHPHVKQVRYLNQSGSFKPVGLDDRYFFMVFYDLHEGAEWKLDISFWLDNGVRPEPLQDAIEQQLTPETRLAILHIKDEWYQLSSYRQEVYSTDIYDAVLQHGVRTPSEFDAYLARRGKPLRAKN